MKKIIYLLLAVFPLFFFAACNEDDEKTPPSDNIIPETFRIDIPSSISSDVAGGKLMADPDSVFDMAFVYEGLPTFIEIGENSSEIVEEIISAIRRFNLSNAQVISFISDDDGRAKELEVKENVNLGGSNYQYGMQIIDVNDNAIAMQVFWNNNPIEGFAVINVFQMDRATNDSSTLNSFYKVRYSENIPNFDAEMEVWVSGYPLTPGDTFALDGLHMMARKVGSVVSVYGNSNHPGFYFNNGNSGVVGRNYAFRARGDETNDVGVAEIGLPPSNVNTISNLYTNFNILEVCKTEYGNAVEPFLFNYKSPGYFSEAAGFLGDGDYQADPLLWPASFVDLSGLNPFVPKDVRDLQIQFESF